MNYDEWAMRGTIVLIFGELIGNPRADLDTIRKADALDKIFPITWFGFCAAGYSAYPRTAT